jgi:hypothetical protein
MTQIMSIMEDFLNYRGFAYLRLDGSTKVGFLSYRYVFNTSFLSFFRRMIDRNYSKSSMPLIPHILSFCSAQELVGLVSISKRLIQSSSSTLTGTLIKIYKPRTERIVLAKPRKSGSSA